MEHRGAVGGRMTLERFLGHGKEFGLLPVEQQALYLIKLGSAKYSPFDSPGYLSK